MAVETENNRNEKPIVPSIGENEQIQNVLESEKYGKVKAPDGDIVPQFFPTPGHSEVASPLIEGDFTDLSGREYSYHRPTRQAQPQEQQPRKEGELVWPDTGDFSYSQDVINYIQKRRDELDDAKKKYERDKRWRRTEGIIGSLSDTARALVNLIGTTQYAPDMYDHSQSLTPAMKARFDKIDAQRKAEDEEYYNLAMKLHAIRQADDEKRYQRGRERLLFEFQKREQERKDAAEKRKEAKEDYDEKRRELELEYLQGRIDRNSYLSEQARLQTEYMKKTGTKMPTTPRPSSGSGGGSRGGGRGQYYTTYNDVTYRTKTDYEADLYSDAADYGVPTTTGVGRHQKKRESREIRADVDRKRRGNSGKGNGGTGGKGKGYGGGSGKGKGGGGKGKGY